jgi:hypothetical protein
VLNYKSLNRRKCGTLILVWCEQWRQGVSHSACHCVADCLNKGSRLVSRLLIWWCEDLLVACQGSGDGSPFNGGTWHT